MTAPSGRGAPLARRISLVTAGAVLITVAVTALVSVGLVRTAARSDAQQALNRQADVVAALLNTSGGRGVQDQPIDVLRTQSTPVALLTPGGSLRGDPLARNAIAPRLTELAAGRAVSFRTNVAGREVLVAARPLPDRQGVVLARTTATATALAQDLLLRQLLALLAGLVVALAGGLLLARRLAAPLRRAAAAADRLASGERNIEVRPEGPAEVARLAHSLNTLTAALHTSEARQREFLLSVSHELRTPLTAVKGFAEALADRVVTGDAAAEAGRTVLAESTRLERLVNDLLDLARSGTADFPIDIVPVDLTALLTEAAQVWSARCAESDVTLRTELPDGPCSVSTDPARLRQIVDGLMENALRVTPAGAPIVLALYAEPDLLVEVRDGGPGLTPEDREVAFQRFALYQRYRGVRQVGTGLGLALVHTLATRIGATATAHTAPEGGACFRISLPAAQES
ncbi:sensor histidine kinase [Pseudonocardia acaciae]|uniref:sensor histidine kinase n=1 Tax=Pseudonocardia acaciae TaxID=551276 RepID=UPI00048E24B6|nr:HAMP domain-containing sensor histidine kinase [Pseudonocardia acaciae]